MPTKSKETILVKRLKSAMKEKELNPSGLAEAACVGSTFVYDILKGKSKNPTTSKLSSVAEILDVSVSWLYGEEEEMAINKDAILLPSLSIKEDAGKFSLIKEENLTIPYYFHKNWLASNFTSKIEDMAVTKILFGDMSPTLQKGDIILVDTSINKFIDDGIYTLITDGFIDVKRLSTKGDKLIITSDHKDIEDSEMDKNSVQIAGKILWFSRFC